MLGSGLMLLQRLVKIGNVRWFPVRLMRKGFEKSESVVSGLENSSVVMFGIL